MRFAAPFLFTVVVAPAAVAANPPKVDLKKGIEFIGRAEGTVVEIRPRVTGYLDRVRVKGGDAVKKGDVLAEIDDRPYRLKLDAAKAELVVARAQEKVAAAEAARLKEASEKGIVSKEEYTKVAAAQEEAEARVEVAKVGVRTAELDLSWTKLTAPMDGRVRPLVLAPGNLLKANETMVVSVVKTDPLHIPFDVDERTALEIIRAQKDAGGNLTAAVAFLGEDGFPHPALVTIGCVVDPVTGAVQFRATLPNPKGEHMPGASVRVRLSVQPGK